MKIEFRRKWEKDTFAYANWPLVPRDGDIVSVHTSDGLMITGTVYSVHWNQAPEDGMKNDCCVVVALSGTDG